MQIYQHNVIRVYLWAEDTMHAIGIVTNCLGFLHLPAIWLFCHTLIGSLEDKVWICVKLFIISYTTWRAHKWRSKWRFSDIDIVPNLVYLLPYDGGAINCVTLAMTSQLTWQLWRTQIKHDILKRYISILFTCKYKFAMQWCFLGFDKIHHDIAIIFSVHFSVIL